MHCYAVAIPKENPATMEVKRCRNKNPNYTRSSSGRHKPRLRMESTTATANTSETFDTMEAIANQSEIVTVPNTILGQTKEISYIEVLNANDGDELENTQTAFESDYTTPLTYRNRHLQQRYDTLTTSPLHSILSQLI